jgi:hypothetical protein
VEHRIREEQQAMDRKIVLELDRKVADQQSTLEKAGVAGFYVTTNPQVSTWACPSRLVLQIPEGPVPSGAFGDKAVVWLCFPKTRSPFIGQAGLQS